MATLEFTHTLCSRGKRKVSPQDTAKAVAFAKLIMETAFPGGAKDIAGARLAILRSDSAMCDASDVPGPPQDRRSIIARVPCCSYQQLEGNSGEVDDAPAVMNVILDYAYGISIES